MPDVIHSEGHNDAGNGVAYQHRVRVEYVRVVDRPHQDGFQYTPQPSVGVVTSPLDRYVPLSAHFERTVHVAVAPLPYLLHQLILSLKKLIKLG
jgi:hypothetical protein